MPRFPWPLPEPRDFGWTLKPLESARTSVVRLGDGRLELRIDHDTIRGVSTEMLTWWFQMFDHDIAFRGRTLQAYLLWHPYDHVGLRLTRDRQGRVSPGQRIHIRETFQRSPEFVIDAHVLIHRWDRGAIGFHVDQLGHRVFELDHVFSDVPSGGVDYRSCLRVGAAVGPLRSIINGLVVPRRFSDAQAAAWLRHNVEEVGCFENFLPEIYASRQSEESAA